MSFLILNLFPSRHCCQHFWADGGLNVEMALHVSFNIASPLAIYVSTLQKIECMKGI